MRFGLWTGTDNCKSDNYADYSIILDASCNIAQKKEFLVLKWITRPDIRGLLHEFSILLLANHCESNPWSDPSSSCTVTICVAV